MSRKINSRQEEVLNELRTGSPLLANFKEKLMAEKIPAPSFDANMILTPDTKVVELKPNRRRWLVAAVLAPLIGLSAWYFNSSNQALDQEADFADLEEELLLEVLAQQSYKMDTEELISIGLASAQIKTSDLIDHE